MAEFTYTDAQWAALAQYVKEHAGDDVHRLMLKSEPGLSFDKRFAMTQIECRQRARHKIAEILECDGYIFAKPICAEQCTHELVAKLHAELIGDAGTVLDMTMGQGVDSHYIAQRVQSVTAIEMDPLIAAAGKHNAAVLHNGVQVIEADSTQWLESTDAHFGAIFIDPARRAASGKRLFGLSDCQPDVLGLLPLIKKHTSRLVIKASPMVDVTQGCRDLAPWLTHVWVVSVKNECKELLFDLDFSHETIWPKRHAVNFTANGDRQEFTAPKYEDCLAFADPTEGCHLLEPNVSIMKLGAHQVVASHYRAINVAPDSHLYVASEPPEDFPGRVFMVDEVVEWSSSAAKRLAKEHKQLNVATRNFKLSADALKKKLRVTDGGNCYAFGTTLSSGKQVLLLCHKA